jgi:hypothetical protein
MMARKLMTRRAIATEDATVPLKTLGCSVVLNRRTIVAELRVSDFPGIGIKKGRLAWKPGIEAVRHRIEGSHHDSPFFRTSTDDLATP